MWVLCLRMGKHLFVSVFCYYSSKNIGRDEKGCKMDVKRGQHWRRKINCFSIKINFISYHNLINIIHKNETKVCNSISFIWKCEAPKNGSNFAMQLYLAEKEIWQMEGCSCIVIKFIFYSAHFKRTTVPNIHWNFFIGSNK